MRMLFPVTNLGLQVKLEKTEVAVNMPKITNCHDVCGCVHKIVTF